MSDTITITFAVPQEHAVAFQRQAQGLLNELLAPRRPSAEGTFAPLTGDAALHRDVWSLPAWTADDLEDDRLAWVLRNLAINARAVVSYMTDQAGEIVMPDELVKSVSGVRSRKSLPPSFRSICDKCRRAGRRPLYENRSDGPGYFIRPEVAEWINAASTRVIGP